MKFSNMLSFAYVIVSCKMNLKTQQNSLHNGMKSVADPGEGGPRGACPPLGPVKIVINKMVAKGGRIDFLFLAPPPTRPLDPLLEVINY